MSAARFALLGSGEFMPWTREVDRAVFGDAPPDPERPLLILPTASAPEGDEVFDGWGNRGLAHYGDGGRVLPLRTREDAERADLVASLERARGVYVSGGNPAYLARVLAGSAFWESLSARLTNGMPYVGCSAGVAALGRLAPDTERAHPTARREDAWVDGLALFPQVVFGPHWNRLDDYERGLRGWVLGSVPEGCLLVGIDEDTALLGDGRTWRVVGAGGVELIGPDGATAVHPAGSAFELDLMAG